MVEIVGQVRLSLCTIYDDIKTCKKTRRDIKNLAEIFKQSYCIVLVRRESNANCTTNLKESCVPKILTHFYTWLWIHLILTIRTKIHWNMSWTTKLHPCTTNYHHLHPYIFSVWSLYVWSEFDNIAKLTHFRALKSRRSLPSISYHIRSEYRECWHDTISSMEKGHGDWMDQTNSRSFHPRVTLNLKYVRRRLRENKKITVFPSS